MTDLVTQTLDQLERVVAIRERYREISRAALKLNLRTPTAPTIFLMTMDIDRAKAAIRSMDPASLIPALDSLKGYSDD